MIAFRCRQGLWGSSYFAGFHWALQNRLRMMIGCLLASLDRRLAGAFGDWAPGAEGREARIRSCGAVELQREEWPCGAPGSTLAADWGDFLLADFPRMPTFPFVPELEPAAGEWASRRGAGACIPALAGSRDLRCDQIPRPGASLTV